MSEKPAQTTFPVGLLLDGKQALVVGGGKVALRKAASLTKSGALVKVVAPVILNDFNQLEPPPLCAKRVFRPSDLDSVSLVFSATDDKEVNDRVLAGCRAAGVLCCVVDRGWSNGDFISPSVFHSAGMTFSVSSGGQNCRRTRFYRQYLERRLPRPSLPQLLVIGVSHHSASLEEREKLALNPQEQQQRNQRLACLKGLHEFFILETCNRLELYGIWHEDKTMAGLIEEIAGFSALAEDKVFRRRGWAAFAHACKVASGLYSQTPLENHIVAQIKEAFSKAEAKGWSAKGSLEWLNGVLRVSKAIRQKARPLIQPKEIETLALDWVKKGRESALRGVVIVVGSGLLGCRLAKDLNGRCRRLIRAYHRNRPPALPDKGSVQELITLAELPRALAEAEAVFLAVNSDKPVIDFQLSGCFAAGRKTYVVDLGAPRNADNRLKELDSVELVDLEDLKHCYRREEAVLKKINALAKEIIDRHRNVYEKLADHP